MAGWRVRRIESARSSGKGVYLRYQCCKARPSHVRQLGCAYETRRCLMYLFRVARIGGRRENPVIPHGQHGMPNVGFAPSCGFTADPGPGGMSGLVGMCRVTPLSRKPWTVFRHPLGGCRLDFHPQPGVFLAIERNGRIVDKPHQRKTALGLL